MPGKYGIELTVDTTQANQSIQTVVANLRALQAELFQLEKADVAADLSAIAENSSVAFRELVTRLEQAKAAILELQRLQKRLRSGEQITRPPPTSPAAQFLNQEPFSEAIRRNVLGGGNGVPGMDQLIAGEERAKEEAVALDQALAELVATHERLAQEAPTTWEQITAAARNYGQIEQQIEQLTGGGAVERALRERQQLLNQSLDTLIQQRSELEGSVFSQLSAGEKKRYEIGRAALEREARLRDDAVRVSQRLLQIQEQIAAVRGQSAARNLNVDVTDADALRKLLADINDEAKLGADLTAEQQQEIRGLLQQRIDLEAKAADEGVKATKALSGQEIQRALVGVDGTFKELNRRIGEARNQLELTFTPGAVAQIFPELLQHQLLINQLNQEYHAAAEGSAEQAAAAKKLGAALAEVDQVIAQSAARGVPLGLSPGQFTNELNKAKSGLTKLFESVFTDFGRRFTATLQFALSAGLIFGVQRVLREFIDTAIEVERAFADIETALTLDPDIAARGTVEFRRQVEDVRQEVLLLAEEFNTLPTEANKAAFVMVSRFDDVGNAMAALRAQLLATKISTIDQSEVLRALTAVAEGFASATLEVNDGLSLQQKLAEREAASARLYGQALDLATQIQQQFGIEVEDTLEGGARATEVFRQMGFTMEETFAIVAATSRELGQTGQQAAERLNRSIGQLTDPRIRDALLELAATSEDFTLTFADFESGATAWKKIVDQFQRLESVDPSTAREILQIIGQRRELEAVAAALGTADLQQSIIASSIQAVGAAERRFGFLRQTVSELLASIAEGFQELAQNFERLGGLTSLKLILTSFDQLIGLLNTTLKFVIDIGNALDDVLGIPFTGFVRGVLSVVATLGLALNIALRLREAFTALAGSQFIATVSGFLGAATASAGTTAGIVGTNAALRNALVPEYTLLKNILAQVTTQLSRFASYLGITAAGFGAVVVAGLVLAAGIKSIGDKAERLANSFRQSEADLQRATVEARNRIAREGLTGAAAQTAIDEARQQALLGSFQGAESASPGLAQFLGAQFLDIMQPWRMEFIHALGRSLHPENIPGSKEFFRKRILEIDEALIRDAAAALQEDLGTVDFEVPAPTQVESFLTTDPVELLGLNKIEEAQTKLNFALSQLDDLPDDPDARAAALADIDAEVTSAVASYTEGLSIAGKLPEQLEFAIQSFDEQMKSITSRLQIGEITGAEAIRLTLDIAAQRKAFAEGIATQDPQLSQEQLNQAREETLQGIQLIIDEAKAVSEAGSFRRTEINQLQIELGNLRQALRDAIAAGASTNGQVVRDLTNEIAEKQQQLGLAYHNEAVAVAQQQATLARTFDEQQRASQNLAYVYRALAAFWLSLGRSDLAREALTKAISEEQQALERRLAEESKRAVATIRLNRPILSEAARIEAEIARANLDRKNATSRGDYLDATVRLKELLAQQAQLELRRLTAQARAEAGVRNAIGQQQVVLKSLISEQRLTARLIGRNSTEWHELQIRIEEARATLFDLVLELESINRLLGIDITNPLEEAEAAYVDAMRALQIPDLGEIEKARAELDANRAAANLERARFDEALFDLNFLVETGQLSTSGYISALQELLSQVDTSTHQGKEIFLQIQSLIESLTNDIGDMQFNIPGSIRLPTLFEIRRAVEADALGVNYLDNRQFDVRVNVETVADLGELLDTLSRTVGTDIIVDGQRVTAGNSNIANINAPSVFY